jgi:hypothetical protein
MRYCVVLLLLLMTACTAQRCDLGATVDIEFKNPPKSSDNPPTTTERIKGAVNPGGQVTCSF